MVVVSLTRGSLFAFNILLIIAALTAGILFYHAANRYFAKGTILIVPHMAQGHLNLEAASHIPGLSRESLGSTIISVWDRLAYTQAIFCDADYFSIHFLNFIEGGSWQGLEANRIVLNEALAWYLFGSSNIVGLTVTIQDSIYTVSGVARQGDGGFTAWLPITDQEATAIYLTPYPYHRIDAVSQALRQLNFDPALPSYSLIDIGMYTESIAVRFRLLLYAFWLLLLFLLPFKSYGYLSGIAGIAICVIVAVGVYDILLWLPNLSNTTFLNAVAAVDLFPADFNMSYGLMQLNQLNSYANYVLVAGMLFGGYCLVCGVKVQNR
jgi:hypothetical protein